MSCQWGSKYLFVSNEEPFHIIPMDQSASLVAGAPGAEWLQQPQPQIHRTQLKKLPAGALDIVTTGKLTNEFRPQEVCTIGCAFKTASLLDLGNGKSAKAQIWDTAGQERFRTIGRAYWRCASLALLVFDVTNPQEENVRNWMTEIKNNTDQETCFTVVVGNKIDLLEDQEKPVHTIRQLCYQEGVYYFEGSAKTGEGLVAGFARMVSQLYMEHWRSNKPFSLAKVVLVGDSGVGKTAITEQFGGFAVDLHPLAAAYPIKEGQLQPSSEHPPQNNQLNKNQPTPLVYKKIAYATTNSMSLNLGHLGAWDNFCELATGDAQVCSSCGSAFCKTNTAFKTQQGEEMWACDFCHTKCRHSLEKEEIPKTASLDYVLEDATVHQQEVEEDGSMVIFCLDVSGSMIVTSEITPKQAKTMKLKNKTDLEGIEIDAAPQHLPNEKRGVAYISRLEAVQAAIQAQITMLAKKHPSRRVGLVTFSNEVTCYGDGSSDPVIITGSILESEQNLQDLRKWNPKGYQSETPYLASLNSISKSYKHITSKIDSLSEHGQTAMGPALLISTLIASERSGSKVILCTDGLANIGIGSTDSNADLKDAKIFYESIGAMATKNNTSISLMSFKGSDSNVQIIGKLATDTGGQLDIVDPSEINTTLQSIFEDSSIARDVRIRMYLPPGISIPTTCDWLPLCNSPLIVGKQIGSVNSDSNLVIPLLVDGKQLNNQNNTKFQLQISYTRVGELLGSTFLQRLIPLDNGAKLLRVISHTVPITHDRTTAERFADPEAVALCAMRSVAAKALDRYYTVARLENYAYLQLMKRIANTSNAPDEAKDAFISYSRHNSRLERALQAEQVAEIKKGLRWDETDHRCHQNPSPQNTSESFLSFSSISQAIYDWFVPQEPEQAPQNANKIETEKNIGKILEQRNVSSDELSNLLWNVSSSNMI